MGHSLSLDKVITKMILRQNGLPTPDFAVLQSPDSPVPKMKYPVVVKPRNESVSFGLKVVNNEKELVEAAKIIFDQFDQPVLAEQYVDGRKSTSVCSAIIRPRLSRRPCSISAKARRSTATKTRRVASDAPFSPSVPLRLARR